MAEGGTERSKNDRTAGLPVDRIALLEPSTSLAGGTARHAALVKKRRKANDVEQADGPHSINILSDVLGAETP